MGFNIEAARRDGVTDSEIADYLAGANGFNIEAARKDGVPDAEIAAFLSSPTDTTGDEGGILSKLPIADAAVKALILGNDLVTAVRNAPGAIIDDVKSGMDQRQAYELKKGAARANAAMRNRIAMEGTSGTADQLKRIQAERDAAAEARANAETPVLDFAQDAVVNLVRGAGQW